MLSYECYDGSSSNGNILFCLCTEHILSVGDVSGRVQRSSCGIERDAIFSGLCAAHFVVNVQHCNIGDLTTHAELSCESIIHSRM